MSTPEALHQSSRTARQGVWRPRESACRWMFRARKPRHSSIIIARIAISNARISAGLQSSNSARNVAWRIFEVAICCLFYSFSPVSLAVAIGGKCLSPPPPEASHPYAAVFRDQKRHSLCRANSIIHRLVRVSRAPHTILHLCHLLRRHRGPFNTKVQLLL